MLFQIRSLVLMFLISLIINSCGNHQSTAPTFVNTIVDGNICNGLGVEKSIQNSDATSAYSVTVKVVFFDPGNGTKESQRVERVPAGGKTYLGCSAGIKAGATFDYSVIGESKQ